MLFPKKTPRKPGTSPLSLRTPVSCWLMVKRPSPVRCSQCLIPIGLYLFNMTLNNSLPAKGLFMVKSDPEITKRIQTLCTTTRADDTTPCVLAFAAFQHRNGRGLSAGNQCCPCALLVACLASCNLALPLQPCKTITFLNSYFSCASSNLF